MAGELTHTEEEASKILCPEFKTGCRGSGCMWWRWHRGQLDRESRITRVGPLEDAKPPHGEGWTWEARTHDGLVKWVRYVAVRGYCGVAGQP